MIDDTIILDFRGAFWESTIIHEIRIVKPAAAFRTRHDTLSNEREKKLMG
jgi:hypothetical protein